MFEASAMKLNSLPRNLFEITETDSKIRVCASEEISRNDLIATGRLLTCEHIGRAINDRKGQIVKYASRLDGTGLSYGDLSKKHMEKKLLYCAALAKKAVGEEPYTDVADVKSDYDLIKNANFRNAMASIDKEVIRPLLFSVFDDVSANGFMDWSRTGLTGTKEIVIESNDVFVFQDTGLGSLNNVERNYTYKDTITISPKSKACSVRIKWTRLVDGDAGDYYAAIMRGLWSKIYATFTQALLKAAENVEYMPTALKAETYTNANWIKITKNVAKSAGVDRSNVVCFGAIEALSCVLPKDAQGNLLGMQSVLVSEWFKTGFVGKQANVDLIEINPAVVPGTQNTTLNDIFPTDKLFFAAKGAGAAPLQGVYAEGSPISITINFADSDDLAYDITIAAFYDIAAVFANKVGLIDNVVA